jgi:hypothetical protein
VSVRSDEIQVACVASDERRSGSTVRVRIGIREVSRGGIKRAATSQAATSSEHEQTQWCQRVGDNYPLIHSGLRVEPCK